MPQIKIKIDTKTWQMSLDAEGYSGNSCVADLDNLQALLDMKDKRIIPKAEMFYEAQPVVVKKNKETLRWKK